MNARENLVFIKTGNLYPHPDNPRKDLGDITEMTESVRKNGVMQNLTIMPLSCLDLEPEAQVEAEKTALISDFYVLIGHRRLAAAKAAGIEKVPCKIVSKISKKEQVGIMLEENMQRSDLTVYEQAQGFQMMLDLGETADTIAEKTGFSKTTIYHRLNLAKLDKKTLESKNNDTGFQMNISDLYALEQIEDVKLRNKVLKESTDSKNLAFRAKSAAIEEKRSKNEKQIVKELFKREIKPAPNGTYYWDSKWERVKEIDLDKEVPKNYPDGKEEMFFIRNSGTLYILKKKKQEKQEKSDWELKREAVEKKKKELKKIVNRMDENRKNFILDIVNGKVEPVRDEFAQIQKLWKLICDTGASVQNNRFLEFFTGKSVWSMEPEEKEAACKKMESLSMAQQMTIIAFQATSGEEFWNYNTEYRKDEAEQVKMFCEFLEEYGFSIIDEEERQVLDGTHKFYEKG